MKHKFTLFITILLGIMVSTNVFARTSKKEKSIDQLVNKFAQSSFRDLINKKHFKVSINENRPIYFDKEEFSYNQTLVFKTKRGFICQGGLSFDISLNKKILCGQTFLVIKSKQIKKEEEN
jgi:hypothetical protein